MFEQDYKSQTFNMELNKTFNTKKKTDKDVKLSSHIITNSVL